MFGRATKLCCLGVLALVTHAWPVRAQDSGAPAALHDPLAVLKDIPLDPSGWARLGLGGQLRWRVEDSRANDFGFAKPVDNRPLLFRTLLSADLKLGPSLRLYGETVSGFAPMWTGLTPGTQSDALDLLQGFAEATLPLTDGRLQVTAGRQEMTYGSSRLVSLRDSPNVRRSFDGVRAAWIGSSDTRIDAFAVRPVVPQTGIFNDQSDPGQRFWGLYGTTPIPLVPGLKGDLYYFGLDRDVAKFAQGTAPQQTHTFGTRLFGKAGGLDWNLEGDVQVGSFGTSSVRAWMLAGDVGYTLDGLPFQPRIGVKADAASGDGNPHDRTLGTFYPLYPKLPTFSEANIVVPANLIDVQPNVTLTLMPSLKASVGWNPFWKASQADAYYNAALLPVPGTAGGPGRYLGQQLVTTLLWQPARQVEVGFTYVPFRPGARLKLAGGRDGSFAAGWISFTF
ncbi:MAG: alginate export family protein [Alsobacter sp.]